MLKKEFKDVLKQTLFLFGALILFIFIFYLRAVFSAIDFSFSEMFPISYQLFTLFFSFFLGISLFSSETGNSGLEYMLTFPFSRTRLLFYKLIPRVVILFLLYLGYLVLSFLFVRENFIITPVIFNSLYFSVFLISTSLSPLKDNFVANSIATLFLILFFIAGANIVGNLVFAGFYGRSFPFKLYLYSGDFTDIIRPGYTILLSFLLSIPFILSFFLAFKKFDIRSSGRYLKRFVLFFVPMFIGGMVLSFFVVNGSVDTHNYNGYYLTKEGNVIQDTYTKSWWYEGKNKKEISSHIFWSVAYEDVDCIYSIKSGGKPQKSDVYRLNKKSLKPEKIYPSAEGKKMYAKIPVYGYKNIIAFFESGSKGYGGRSRRNLVFIDKQSLVVKKIKAPERWTFLCGVSQSGGKRIWIGYAIRSGGIDVYAFFEDGIFKRILWSEKKPVFINNKLITYRGGNFIFGKFSAGIYREIKKIKMQKNYYFPQFYGYYQNDLERKDVRYIYGTKKYGKDNGCFLKVDVETYEIEELKYDFAKRGFLRNFFNGDTIFIRFTDKEPKVNGIFRFEGADLVPLKVFEKENFEIWKDFSILKNGFMIRKKQKKIFYKYPGLKELTFKGL